MNDIPTNPLLFHCRQRPDLIATLDLSLPRKCSSCAARFADTPEGREEKAAHLDWHFRVRTAMLDAGRIGQNRSWYVGEEVSDPCEQSLH